MRETFQVLVYSSVPSGRVSQPSSVVTMAFQETFSVKDEEANSQYVGFVVFGVQFDGPVVMNS